MNTQLLDQARDIRPGEELPVEKLATYLQTHLPQFSGALGVKQCPNGHSNLTYALQVGGREFILRRPPFGANIKTAHDMSREYKILSHLHPVYGKVPRP